MDTNGADQPGMSQEQKDDLREIEVAAVAIQAKAAEEEADAAEKQVDTQKRTVRIQAIALFLAAVATLAAAYAALQAGNAVRASEGIASQQELENRLTTAITAVGGKSPTEQVAGLTLLQRNVESRILEAKQDASERQDAYETYVTSLGVFDVYLRTTVPGHKPSIAAIYAGDELSALLSMASQVKAIDGGQPIYIDLSLVALPGINWTGVRFDRLTRAWMPKIDLRGADLAGSHWGHATLTHAYLQCADLKDADLRQANLAGADLRGADLTNAKLPPAAELKGVKTARAVGPVNGLHIKNPATSYQLNSCLTTPAYADVP
ncbi:MAG: pentapeptide repeat-containing protein [Streptosporangiaceae bacterium]